MKTENIFQKLRKFHTSRYPLKSILKDLIQLVLPHGSLCLKENKNKEESYYEEKSKKLS